jgi:hypothetical protein
MKRLWTKWIIVLAVTMGLAAGASAKDKSLYDRLGGKKAITAVVDEFVARVAADNRINGYFKGTGGWLSSKQSLSIKSVRPAEARANTKAKT